MWTKYLVFVLLLLQLSQIQAKVIIIVSHIIDKCIEIPKDEEANIMNWSDVDIYLEDDTHGYINGSIIFAKPVTTIPGHAYAQRYSQGKWLVQGFDRKYEDFCLAWRNPNEPFFMGTKHFPGCPIEAGYEWIFNMVAVEVNDALLQAIPPHYCGNWRFTTDFQFEVDGKIKHDCRRFYADIFEDNSVKI